DSLWFWLFLILQWGMILFRPMGVSIDLFDDPSLPQVTALQKQRWMAPISPLWVGAIAFVLTLLVLLSVMYNLELAQAGLLILGPWIIALALTRRVANHVDVTNALPSLKRVQWRCQIIAVITVFVATVVGISHNLPVVG
ncbi:MAG: hypothetical protein AAF701_09925, partial [Pseudomonadota bacterium]